ncbi:MAG: ribonuclease HII [Bryobacteraceae bacterium]
MGHRAADAYEIDRINIYQATRVAMCRAIEKLSPRCDYLLIDAVRLDLSIPQESIIQGDVRCQSIAAASILAKTARDACMRRWDELFPQYHFASNKGYGTDLHYEALRKYGPTMMHRFSFEPVRLSCQMELWSGYDQKEMSLSVDGAV